MKSPLLKLNVKLFKKNTAIITLLLVLLPFIDVWGQGTACTNAVSVTLNTNYTGYSITDNTVNDPTEAAVNGQTMSRDGWFSFVSVGSEATIRVVSSNRNPMIFAYSGTCGSLTLIGSINANTNTAGHTEILTLTGLTNGATYYVRVGNSTANNMPLSSLSITSGVFVPSTGNNSFTLCSGNLYDNGGSAVNYAASSTGYTVINPSTPGDLARVSGSITSEAGYDYLTIYDGTGTGGTILWGGSAHGSGTACTTFTVPTVTSTTGPLTVRFYSDGSTNCAGFNLSISCYTPPTCSGTPIGGTVTATPTSGDPGSTYGVTATGYTTGAGLTYQWQYSDTGAAPWTNQGSATSSYLTLTGLTAPAFGVIRTWRLLVTCTASSSSTGSSTATFTSTHCTPISSNTADYISGFSTTGGVTNITNTPTTLSGTGYGNFYTTQTASQYAGSSLNFTETYVGGNHGFSIWVDFNNNGVFETTERLYDAGTTAAGFTGTITIPGGTTVGDYRMRVRAWWNNLSPDPCTAIAYGEAEDYKLTVLAPLPQTYTSSTVTQNNITDVAKGAVNSEVIAIPIVMNGALSPLSATSFTINTTGTTNVSDISNAKLWYTGNSATFSTTTQFGSTVASPSGTFNITGTQVLANGTNYFWLTYDVNSGATTNNLIDAGCTTITVGGSSYTPTITAPSGTRKIVALRNWIGAGVVGGTGGTDFNTATNWSPTGVPGATDEAIITTTTAATITLSANVTIDKLTVLNNGNVSLALDASTFVFTINNESNFNCFTAASASSRLAIRVGNTPGHIIFKGNANFGPNGSVNPFLGFEGSSAGTTTGNVTFEGDTTFSVSYATLTGSIGTFIFDKNGVQTISTNPTYVVGFPGAVQIGNTNTPTLQLSTTTATGCFVGLNRNMTIKSGATLDLKNRYFYPSAASTGIFTIESGGFLICGNNSNNATGTNNFPPNFSSYNLNTNSTVEYNAIIAQGINATPTYGNLTISNNSTKTASTSLNIAGNFLINPTATFAAGTSLTHNLAGNWTNNGTFSYTTANTINFNGSNLLQTVSGTSTTDFNSLTVNKGTSIANILEMNGPNTMNGTLTLTNGLLRLNHASSNAQPGGGLTIPISAGIEVNGGTLNGNNGTITNNGLFRIINGNATIGAANGNSINNATGSTCDIQGGNMTVAGRIRATGGSFSQTGGTINLCTIGNASATIANFDMSATSNIDITGGTIIFRNPNTNAIPYSSISIASGGTKSITGGTFQIGDTNTPAGSIFKINSAIALNNFTINGTTQTKTAVLEANLAINGNVLIENGLFDLVNFTNDRTSAGGSYSIKTTGYLKIGATNTFPSNFSTHEVDATSTVEYNGNNQNVAILNSSQNYGYLILSGIGNKTFDDLVTVENNLTNATTSTATLTTGKSLIVKNQLINNGIADNFVFENNSSLIQVNNVSNIGEIKYNRTSPLTVNTSDYVYWSSPVNNQIVPPGVSYFWNNAAGTTGNWVSAVGQPLTEGKGVIIRGVGTKIFSGVPHNGEINITVYRRNLAGYTDNWNLIGNPYASAMSADEFLADADNSIIEGSIALWTHGSGLSTSNPNPFYGTFAYNYNPNDYIIYNSFASQAGPSTFNGNIAAGQAFFVKYDNDDFASPTPASGSIKIKNSMRTNSVGAPFNNSQFYRTDQNNSSIEKHRIWLDLIYGNSAVTRTVVGYSDAATDTKDRLFDASTSVSTSNIKLYSLIGTNKMSIQAKSLPFNDIDQIPLGYNAPNQGSYIIGIHALDGIFEGNQEVYLEDTQLGIQHNLKVNPYHFTSLNGENNTRFKLRFNNSTLDNSDFDFLNTVLVYTDNNKINLSSTSKNIQSIRVVDLLGRELGYYNTINSSNYEIQTIEKTNSPLILEVTFENNIYKNYKIIF